MMLELFDAVASLVSGTSQTVQHTALLWQESSDDQSGIWLLAAGPAAGVALYGALYRYYRNTDKSHSFERETRISSQPITGTDAKVDEVRGTRRKRIDGDNSRNYRERVQRVE